MFNAKQNDIWDTAYRKHHIVMLKIIMCFLVFYFVMIFLFPVTICLFAMVYFFICKLNRQSSFYADQVLATYYSKSFMKGYFMQNIRRVGVVNRFFMLFFNWFTPIPYSWCRISHIKKGRYKLDEK